ncbi:efflux RND transporter permease subunit [Paroceanicella profunda]|uniref:Efflux RND transporter permease subunit n=1 Tax=Paroceanicella profunda TaxID=2579971 RepID=A0A5B8FIY5_9RHOB|nr:efflux RND transporter permease subunit [Paroceanicella profunda]QDL93618.1 efflux RND transporter permease subunit [Paroceanicella profunda]
MDDGAAAFTATFVKRPVLAIVVNLLIVVAGLAALWGAEIRELPDVDRPVITVTTTYDGAAPETIDAEVTDEIEGAATRVAGVKSIASSSSFGRSRVTVEFTDDTDLNVAANDLRDAISRIERDLPDEIDDPRIVKADANASAVMRVAVTSDRLEIQDLTRLVEDEVVDTLAAIDGVADVQVYGDREAILRVDIDQAALAGRRLTIADIAGLLSAVSGESPAGTITSDTQEIVVRANSGLTTPEEYAALMLDAHTRLGDVAKVSFGPDVNEAILRANGQTGVGMGIIRQAQSNTLNISRDVHAAVERMRDILPEGTDIRVTSDDATFIRGSIKEVVGALLLATVIVIGVILLFLRSLRAVLIPAVTMPVALIGTFGGIYLAGFSINILSMLALVLATGMVVDDAIVVLENVMRRRALGLGPRAAALVGVREVFFAVISTTATLAAVFIPISFLPGTAGGLFREFGFVLAISVVISSVVTLTLCPMIAARVLPAPAETEAARRGLLGRVFESLGAGLQGLYARILHAALDAPLVAITIAVVFSLGAGLAFRQIPQELTPPEDRSVLLFSVSTPQGVSLAYTAKQMRMIEDIATPYLQSGEALNLFAIAGRGAVNRGFMVLTLAPWEDRNRSQQQIADEINTRMGALPGARAFAIQPNSLGIRGGGEGLQFAVAGASYDKLAYAASQLMDRMQEDGRFGNIRLSFDLTQPQLTVKVDRERASDLGIDVTGLANAMQALLDGREVGTVYLPDRTAPIKLLSTGTPVDDPTDLENIFLRTASGKIVPMSSIATLTEAAAPADLRREDKLRSVPVTASLGGSLALQDAYREVQRLAEGLMPPGARIIPLAEAATVGETSQGLVMTFAVAIIVVLLVLAAQFESFISALIILLTVPLGLACAVFAILFTGGSLNVYSQIGLVMLVGVMAKNGILIVEFANQLRERGLGLRAAIETASLIRLRPVAMTAISTVLGGAPLVVASGAGAEARIALGWVVVGGLGLATLATLFLTPVCYLLLARFSSPRRDEDARLEAEIARARVLGHPAE